MVLIKYRYCIGKSLNPHLVWNVDVLNNLFQTKGEGQMKILHATDFHCHKEKYEMMIRVIEKHKPDLVSYGADILPKTGDVFWAQYDFITYWLREHLEKVSSMVKHVIIDFGNDDFGCNYSKFLRAIGELKNVYSLHMQSLDIDGYIFRGYNFVPDYPFRLKDWCKLDMKTSSPNPVQFGTPLRSSFENCGKYEEIENFEQHLKPSIQEFLDGWLSEGDYSDEIWFMHSPPKLLGLDVTGRGESVGSVAITNAILKHKPRLTFHGHIHESPRMTGKVSGFLTEKTLSIQPGSDLHDLKYVVVDLSEKRHPDVYLGSVRNDTFEVV